MNIERFIADRVSESGQNKGSISRPIVKIAIAGIALGVAVMLLTVSIVQGFKSEIISRITGLTSDIVIRSVNVTQGSEPQPVTISADTLSVIHKMPFVKNIQATVFKNALLKTGNENEGLLLKGVGEDYDFTYLEKHLQKGRLPEFKPDESSRDIMISESLAEKLGLELDGKMQVYFITQHEGYDSIARKNIIKSEQRSRRFTICGIFSTNFADFDDKLSIVDIRQLRTINYWDSTMAGAYEIRTTNFAELDNNTEAIQELVGYNYEVSSVKENYYNIFIWLDKLDINGVIVVVLMILVATVNMITALLILILERAKMVGLIKSLGMSNVSVRRIFLIISLKLTWRGLLIGNIVGIGLCLLQYYFRIIKLDSETYYVEHVAVSLNWQGFLLLDLGTFLTCAIMLVIPTLIITKMTPVKTLKFD